MRNIQLYNGDCLEVMDRLIRDGVKVDAIITDPPYGTTACKWDSVIPFDAMWERLKKLRKENTPIVLFGSEPFSSALRMSNIKEYKYDWIWKKARPTGFLNAKIMPMKAHEIVSVFCHKKATYKPQGLVLKDKQNKNTGIENVYGKVKKDFIQEITYTNYPNSVLYFNNPTSGNHPTQKPVALMEYLIKTYTNEGDIVLDFTMGSGSTGVACKNLNRRFIGIELDKEYFNIAKKRIENT